MTATAFKDIEEILETKPMGKPLGFVLGTVSRIVGRVGSPRDMAGLVLFLVSAGGAHITGALVETDGGTRMSEGLSKL